MRSMWALASPSPGVFLVASTCASSLHYAASRLAASDVEMHVYYWLAAVVSMVMLLASGAIQKREVAAVKKENPEIDARRGRIRSLNDFRAMMSSRSDVLKMLAFVAVRYVRIFVDGFVLRRNGLIFSLAGRNASATILLVVDVCTPSRKDTANEPRRSRRLMLAGIGAVGCTLLACNGNATHDVLLIASGAALHALHCTMGAWHPSLETDAALGVVLSAAAALVYGAVPRRMIAAAAGAAFALCGGIVGVLYCNAMATGDAALLAGLAQASAVAKIASLPVAPMLIGEHIPRGGGDATSTWGALLTVLAFVWR